MKKVKEGDKKVGIRRGIEKEKEEEVEGMKKMRKEVKKKEEIDKIE